MIYLNDFTRYCECIIGYKLNELSGSCDKCYVFEGECLLSCPENTEKDEQ